MPPERLLFGKKIVPHHLLNFAEQVYDILVAEIELGRWKVNERLPGVINLAKELNFGTKTIQTAYDRLKDEGYVRTLGYRGTYVKSIHPRARSSAGKIGLLVAPEQTADPLILWYEHVILLGARRRNLVTEVKVLPPGFEPAQATRRGALFGDEFAGVVSLTAFPLRVGDDSASAPLPLVFLVPPYAACAPRICADVAEACRELTLRLISSGHTRIAFSEDAIEPDPRQTELHRAGYLEAMKAHGLPVDSALMEVSRRVANDDLPGVGAYLQVLRKPGDGPPPTAVVADSLGRAMALLRAAPLQRVVIPRDLSVVTIGSAAIGGAGDRQITGMLPDFDTVVDVCLNELEHQQKTGRSSFTSHYFRMHLVPGHTFEPVAPEQGRVNPAQKQSSSPRSIGQTTPC